MNIINTLPDPSGLYVLSPEGSLGVFHASAAGNLTFTPDADLNGRLAEKIAVFLTSYLAGGGRSAVRVAIVYNAAEKKPWGHATFLMEESVVREVYPVTGVLAGTASYELTTFQKRNREKSIYRGMETLLAHKTSSRLAIYCPVLFDRGTTLDHYLPMLGRGEQDGDRRTPVLEVLNLVAHIPVLERNSEAILELHEKLHAVLIKSHLRKDSGLSLVDTGAPAAPPAPAAEHIPLHNPGVARAVTMPTTAPASVALRSATVIPIKDFSGLHTSDRHEHIERWQAQPPRSVDAAVLKAFAPFRALGDPQLAGIARQCRLYQAPAGAVLLERGMNDTWHLFLLNGALSLEAQDGIMQSIESGSERAANPVSSLKPRKYRAVAKTPVTFLWLPDALLQSLSTAGAV